MIQGRSILGVTVEFTSRYRQPVPIDEEIRVIGRIEKDTRRFFGGSGEILLSDGSVAVKGHGKYIKLPLEQFGEEYNGYKQRVGMLFPRVF